MARTFIDLGLPSGTLWATENASKKRKRFFTFKQAKETFKNELPTIKAWKELLKKCKKEWNKQRKGYILTGPNGNSIFLPAAAYHKTGKFGDYWTSEAFGEKRSKAVFFNISGIIFCDSGSEEKLAIHLCRTK